MAFIATDKDKTEYIYEIKPFRREHTWICNGEWCGVPKGSIEKLIGRKLTWEDEPLELKEDDDKK